MELGSHLNKYNNSSFVIQNFNTTKQKWQKSDKAGSTLCCRHFKTGPQRPFS